MITGTLYVVPVINAMGPVTDPRHADLLSTWADVDRAVSRIFSREFRERHRDSAGGHAVFSWFLIDWTGFRSNPVHRDFGDFKIFDHYRGLFGEAMRAYGDGLYWMYNHPAASGVGNEWGLDWLQNSHYFEVLARHVIERAYFPSVVEVPTEKNDTSHWLEQWFPFDLGNRYCKDLDLGTKEADGKSAGAVIDWDGAPDDWSAYHPSAQDYRRPGTMRRTVFRLLDIKTRIYQLREDEIAKAFDRCRSGLPTMIAAYEHDFRDRADAIEELMLVPLARLAERYPDVRWRYANALDAARGVLGLRPGAISLDAHIEGRAVRISSTVMPFGPTPFVCSRDDGTGEYAHHPVAVVAERTWDVARAALPDGGILGLAASDESGQVAVRRFQIGGDVLVPIT